MAVVNFNNIAWEEDYATNQRLDVLRRRALSGQISQDTADRISLMVEMYPQIEPDATVALAMAGVDPKSPEMMSLAYEHLDMIVGDQVDLYQQLEAEGGGGVLKSVVRTAFLGANAFFDMVSSAGRIGVGLADELTDDTPGVRLRKIISEGWNSPAQDALFQMGRQLRGGGRVNLGSGFIAESQGSELFSQYLAQLNVDEQREGESFTTARDLVTASFGEPITALNAYRNQQVLLNDQPYSPGRLVGTLVSEPMNRMSDLMEEQLGFGIPDPLGFRRDQVDSPPWKWAPDWMPINSGFDVLTGLTDAWLRIRTDPVNQAMKVRAATKRAATSVAPTTRSVRVPGVIPGTTRKVLEIPGVDDLRRADPGGRVSEFLHVLKNETSQQRIMQNPFLRNLHPTLQRQIANTSDEDEIWRLLTRSFPDQGISNPFLGVMQPKVPWVRSGGIKSRIAQQVVRAREGSLDDAANAELFGVRTALRRTAEPNSRLLRAASDVPHVDAPANDMVTTLRNLSDAAGFYGFDDANTNRMLGFIEDNFRDGHISPVILRHVINGSKRAIDTGLEILENGTMDTAQRPLIMTVLERLRTYIDQQKALDKVFEGPLKTDTSRVVRIMDGWAVPDIEVPQLLDELRRLVNETPMAENFVREMEDAFTLIDLSLRTGRTLNDTRWGHIPKVWDEMDRWLSSQGVKAPEFRDAIRKSYFDDDADDLVRSLGHSAFDPLNPNAVAGSELETLNTAVRAAAAQTPSARLPNFAEMNRAVSKFTKFEDELRALAAIKGKKNPFTKGRMEEVFDLYTQTVFKPLTLGRLAWTVRVVGDEQLRMAVDGRLSMFNHPIKYFSLVMHPANRTKRMLSLLDESPVKAVDEFLDTMSNSANNLLGTNRTQPRIFEFRTLDDTTPARFHGGRAAMMDDLHRDDLVRVLAANGGDEELAYEWLMYDPAGRKYLNQAAQSRYGRALVDPAVAQRNLGTNVPYADDIAKRLLINQKNGVLAQYTGGRFSHRDDALKLAERQRRPQNPLEPQPRLPAEARFVSVEHNHDMGSEKLRQLVATGELDGVNINHLDRIRHPIMTQERRLAKLLETDYPQYSPNSVRVATLPVGLKERWDRGVNGMYRALMSSPTNTLSRSVMWRDVYEETYASLINDVADLSLDDFNAIRNRMTIHHGKMEYAPTGSGALSLEGLEDVARIKAMLQTKDLLYDLSKQNTAMNGPLMRNLIVFGDAYLEVFKAWGANFASNPQAIRTGQILYEGAQRNGIFRPDPLTGEEVFLYPGGEVLAELFGLPDNIDLQLQGKVKNLNMIGGILPPFGPALQVSASLVLPDVPGFNWIRDAVLPFGAVGMVEAAVPLPSWLEKLTALVDEDTPLANQQYAAIKVEVLRHMALGQAPGEPLTQDLFDEAAHAAEQLFVIMALSQFMAPTGPDARFQVLVRRDQETGEPIIAEPEDEQKLAIEEHLWTIQAMSSWYRKAVQNTGSYTAATQQFLKYFNLDPIVASLATTRESQRAHRTRAGVVWEQKNKDIVNDYPQTQSYIVPDRPGDPFDAAAWQRQSESDNVQRRDVETWFYVANDFLARRMYHEAERQAKAIRDNGAIDTATMDRALTQYKWQLQEAFPGYMRDNEPAAIPYGYSERIRELYEWVADPRLENYESTTGLRLYLQARDAVVNELVANRSSGSGRFDLRTTLKSEKNQDLQQYLRMVGEAVIQQYPQFESVYLNLLQQEADPLR